MYPQSWDEFGEDKFLPIRDMEPVLNALTTVDNPEADFVSNCKNAGIKLVPHPFWEELPYVNIFQSITPDFLHQLYQGVVKHIVSWITDAFGPSEINAQCC
jgi:hypothetical protein